MGMHGSVPQFLLDANVAGGLSYFVIYCHERAEGFQSSFVGFQVRSPSQTLCSANFFHCFYGRFLSGSWILRVILILVQSISAVMKKLLNPAGRSAVPQFLLEAQNSDYTPSTSIREEIEGKTMIRENVQLQ